MTPMSCVTSITAAPCSRHSRRSRAMIWAWIETSSAVVGSSAITSRGAPASASAMTTRWRMPPENWCGYWSMRASAAGMPVSWSSSMARRRAAAASRSRCVRMVSTSCCPTVYSGFSEVSGSWKIAPICRPRTRRISCSGRPSMRRPSRRISPPAMRPGGSSRPMIAAPVSDLPAPDSPTTPSTSPAAMSKDTSSSARSVPWRVGNSTRRWRTSSSGPVIAGGG